MHHPGLVRNWPLAQWQRHFRDIYGDINEQRAPEIVWGRLVEHMSGLARSVRNDDKGRIEHFAPRAFAWIFALASRLEMDLEEVMWACYPNHCPHCRKQEGCTCMSEKNTGTRPRRLSDTVEVSDLQQKQPKPRHLQDWMMMLNRVYSISNTELEKYKILVHLQEECAEVHEAMRHKLTTHPKRPPEVSELHLRQEMADLFAWTAAIHNFLRLNPIESYLERLYVPLCPECSHKPCDCPLDFVRDDILLTGYRHAR